MNEQILKGKWKEIKGEIQKTWGQLTGDELEQAKGNVKSISGLIQQRYGHSQDEVSGKLNSIFDRFQDAGNEAAEDIKSNLRRSNDEAH